jgi:hypothetical protein
MGKKLISKKMDAKIQRKIKSFKWYYVPLAKLSVLGFALLIASLVPWFASGPWWLYLLLAVILAIPPAIDFYTVPGKTFTMKKAIQDFRWENFLLMELAVILFSWMLASLWPHLLNYSPLLWFILFVGTGILPAMEFFNK